MTLYFYNMRLITTVKREKGGRSTGTRLDKENIEHFKDDELESKSYTVEDIIKIGKELDNNVKDNKNANEG